MVKYERYKLVKNAIATKKVQQLKDVFSLIPNESIAADLGIKIERLKERLS
jgi:hypothetical protein